MTTRSTTLVESDQLAQAAVKILKNEDFVPKGKRWRFSRASKAHRDYDKSVQEITTRRREARENALEKRIRKERQTVDAAFERAKGEAHAAYEAKIAESKKPFEETEAQARGVRDAAIAAANLAYQHAIEAANSVYRQEATTFDQERNTAMASAKAVHDEAFALLESKRNAELSQLGHDLKTIRLEGPMRVVEDKQAWTPDQRKKALIGIVDMVGRPDVDVEDADLCLRNVVGYVYQDRFLKPESQLHRLMDADLLEALVDLARRTPERRPLVIRYMHDIVEQNPGHSSPVFIKNLTELYVAASADTATVYHDDTVENEKLIEGMRSHIADTLKLTPRRSQVPPREDSVILRPAGAAADPGDDKKTPVMARHLDPEITADVDIRDLVPVDPNDGSEAEAEIVSVGSEQDAGAAGSKPSQGEGAVPPPLDAASQEASPPRNRRRKLVPEGT